MRLKSGSHGILNRIAESLRDSEMRYRLLFDSSRDALMTIAPPSWKFTSGNPAALEMFQAKSVAEFTTLTPWDLSPERQPDGSLSADKAQEMIAVAMREGSHFFEWTHRRLNGVEFPATVLLTRTDMGGQTCVQATVRDITAHKLAEKALLKSMQAVEASRAQYEQVVSMISDIVWRYEVDAKGQFMSSYISPVAEQMLGLPADALKHSFDKFLVYVHPNDLQAVQKTLATTIETLAKDVTIEYRLCKSDGATLWVRSHGSAHLQPDGRVIVIGTTGDITPRKKADQVLLAYQEELRSLASNQALEEDRERQRLATALHDGIGQNLALCRIKLETLEAELARTALATQLTEIIATLKCIIADTRFLTFELSPPVLYEIGLPATLNTLTQNIQRQSGIKCVFKDEGLTVQIGHDLRTILFQAARELLINAVKHARAHEITVVLKQSKTQVLLTVQDDGSGFKQAQTSGTKSKHGFGLFSLREKLRHFGGSCDISTGPNQGTLVSLAAPIMEQSSGGVT